MPKRPSSLRKKRIRLWLQGIRHCAICGIEFKDFEESTVDHIIEISRGGGNDMDNLQLAHQKCNNEKSNNQTNYNWERMALTVPLGDIWRKK